MTVNSLQILGSGSSPGYEFLTGRFSIYNAGGSEIYSSGVVTLTGGSIKHNLATAVTNAKQVKFTGVTWTRTDYAAFAEFGVIGTKPAILNGAPARGLPARTSDRVSAD